MSIKASFAIKGRNPDVLTCIANLSNDEVFTPPELANRMLDDLAAAWAANNNGLSIWSNPAVRFLDPCAKSGVFLREITKRLLEGLSKDIPDLEKRVKHVLENQVFGIGLTNLTALLSRRSLYCSRNANGKFSVVKSFSERDGNIWYGPSAHAWVSDRCSFCGAGKSVFDRPSGLENHAYAFIHNNNPKEFLSSSFKKDMQFDVVIGNPPYQISSDGGTRDVPIYQKFVEQALKLQPRYLSMIIPARWMASGLGLTDFRKTMLSDRHLRYLVDYSDSSEVFPGVDIMAGVCYFLWDAKFSADCSVTSIRAGSKVGPISRNMSEFDVFVRDAQSASILRKVLAKLRVPVNSILARDKEFGWTSNFDDFQKSDNTGLVPLHYIRKSQRLVGFISRKKIDKSAHLVDTFKVLVPKAYGGDQVPGPILGKPLIVSSPSVCTQSFLFFYVKSSIEAESVESYYRTRFFRFLVSLRKLTQDATHSTYNWVPIQQWDRKWTDAELYDMYDFSREDIAHIESLISEL